VCKEHAGTRTRYMWDGHFLLAEWQESDPAQFTQYVFDQTTMTPLLELKSDGSGNYQAYHCHCDPVGALTEMTGNAGQVVWAAEYDVLGGIMMRTGEAAFTSLRFPGQYHDEETGFRYNRHRYYEPALGRFTTPDPLEFTAGSNLYTFPGSPLSTVDLLGLSPVAFLDSSYLVELQRAVERGQSDSWVVRHAMKNKGRLEICPVAYDEFVHRSAAGTPHSPQQTRAAKDILRKFQIKTNVPCLTGIDQENYRQHQEEYYAAM